jgi:Rhodopirellula transposase DDE domain
VDVDDVPGGLYELVAPHLTEKQRRLLAGAAARALGRGGGARMARISGLSRPTVYTGLRELDAPSDPGGRIRATRTSSGLRVHAELDPGRYPLGVKVSDRELAAVPLRRHDWHGEWNYTVPPAAG